MLLLQSFLKINVYFSDSGRSVRVCKISSLLFNVMIRVLILNWCKTTGVLDFTRIQSLVRVKNLDYLITLLF